MCIIQHLCHDIIREIRSGFGRLNLIGKEVHYMLNIFYGDMEKAVYNTAAYFKYDYEDEWIVDPFVKK